MSKTNRIAQAIVQSPVLWGLLATLGLYSLIYTGVLHGEFFDRYFTSSWVLCATTMLFFTGVAALVLKLCEIADQRFRLKQPLLEDVLPATNAIDEANVLIAQLDRLAEGDQAHYLPQRLRAVLDSIRLKGGAQWLDDDMKYYSELDEQRATASYGLVRMIMGVIPILGFLGTVIGLTMALAELKPQQLEGSLSELTTGLSIAFDTTALALALAMALMFIYFWVERVERRLLADVDELTTALLSPRFSAAPGQRDQQVAAMQRMAETVVQATERTVQRQAEIWQSTIHAAHERWKTLTTAGQQQLESALEVSLTKGLEAHDRRLLEGDQAIAERNQQHYLAVNQALEASVGKLQAGLEATTNRIRETLESSITRLEQGMHNASRSTQQALSTSSANMQQALATGTAGVEKALTAGTANVQQALEATTAKVQDLLLAHTHGAKRQQIEMTRTSDVLLQVVRATGEIGQLQDALNSNLQTVASAQTLEETLLSLSAAINLLNARLSSMHPPQVTLQAKASDKAA